MKPEKEPASAGSKPLDDPQHEAFCRLCVQGKTKREAAIAAGFKGKYASACGSKLANNAKIRQRIAYLQAKASDRVTTHSLKLVDIEISHQLKRVAQSDYRWQLIKQVIEERAADPSMAGVPGGKTGLLVRQYKSVEIVGKDGKSRKQTVPEYVFDAALLKEARAHEDQAARELGQIINRTEMTGKDGGPMQVQTVRSILDSLSDEDFDALAKESGVKLP